MTKEEIIEMAKQAGFVDYELDDGTTNAFDKRYEAFAKMVAEHERDYERGFIDGMQKQMQSSVDKAVNRMAQPEQEPVAYINIEERKLEWAYKYMSWDTPTVVNLPKIPLYTTPPQRTWVGLTDEEIDKTLKVYEQDYGWISFAKAIEAKLKEKNCI